MSTNVAEILHQTIEDEHLKIDTLSTFPINGSMTEKTINGWKIGGVIKSVRLGKIYQATCVKNEARTNGMAKIVTPQCETDATMIENEITILR